jgi:PHS family inorganic phosphate transporter-like MFS transporter
MSGRHEGKPDEIARAQGLKAGEQIAIPQASWRDFISYYGTWKNGKILLGTAGSWFMLDVAFYGVNLNTSLVLTAIGYGTGPTVYKILYNVAAGNCILVCAGAIPGYWTTVALVDTVGRKPIQLMGFVCLTILFIVWGFDYNNMKPHAHLAIYVIVQYFFNFGEFLPYYDSIIIPLAC